MKTAKLTVFNILFLFLILVSSTVLTAAEKLRSFETDYCTMFLDGPTNQPGLWKHCCLVHDLRYWFGGSQSDMDISDLSLRTCVNKAAGSTWADLIYYGVRTGHHSPIKNKYQWSWGWDQKRENKSLTKEESLLVAKELRRLNYPEVNMDEFIGENLPLAK